MTVLRAVNSSATTSCPAGVRALAGRAPLVAASVVAGLVLAGCASGPDVTFGGPDEGRVVGGPDLADLAFDAQLADEDPTDGEPLFDAATVTLNDADVTGDAEVTATALRYVPGDLPDGDHEVVIDVPDVGTETFVFAVQATPPEIEITDPDDGLVFTSGDMTIGGRTAPGVEVEVDGAPVEVADDGTFAATLDGAPSGGVTITATDPHGNVNDDEVALTVLPSRVEVDDVRAVHVTPHAWATPSFRERILGMIDDGLINSVQLDIKDESGRIGYDSEVPLAIETGANEGVYDLDEAIADLHEREVHVVGRIVAFRDRVLADHAWENGFEDRVIQTPDGVPYAGYGGFTSFADDDVIEYNLAIAEEAAAAGFDGILWDYIRRPDGPAENLVVPGLDPDASDGAMEQAIVDFTALADERLAPYRVDHGASVYGIAATRPTQIAQDIPAMAEHLDYVAPMLYPSHWAVGEYGVDDPNRQPYDIIHRSLEDFEDAVEGTDTRIVPWYEDTEYREYDRPFHVREQIRAGLDRDIDEWLMWDPVVRYTLEAYEPRDD